MRKPDGALSFIDMLAAGAARTKGIDFALAQQLFIRFRQQGHVGLLIDSIRRLQRLSLRYRSAPTVVCCAFVSATLLRPWPQLSISDRMRAEWNRRNPRRPAITSQKATPSSWRLGPVTPTLVCRHQVAPNRVLHRVTPTTVKDPSVIGS